MPTVFTKKMVPTVLAFSFAHGFVRVEVGAVAKENVMVGYNQENVCTNAGE